MGSWHQICVLKYVRFGSRKKLSKGGVGNFRVSMMSSSEVAPSEIEAKGDFCQIPRLLTGERTLGGMGRGNGKGTGNGEHKERNERRQKNKSSFKVHRKIK